MTVTCDVSYTGGGATNDNANFLFKVLEEMSSMQMGVAMSIKIPTA